MASQLAWFLLHLWCLHFFCYSCNYYFLTVFFKPLNVSGRGGCKVFSWVPLNAQLMKSLGLLPVMVLVLAEGWLVWLISEEMVTQAVVLKWLIVNKKLLIFLHFSARQVSGRRFLVAHMYSTLEPPPYAEPWPCFSLLPLKAAQHGLVVPWGCAAATADTHRLCLWGWKDSSPFP